VSPRLFGYGDYKTFESDKNFPNAKQDGWAEFCTTVANNGWGYTKASLKSTAHLLNYLIKSKSSNMNMLLNYGPDKEGVFSPGMYRSLAEIAGWMKVNAVSINGAKAIDSTESASVPATASGKHRYLFLLVQENTAVTRDQEVVFETKAAIKDVRILGRKEKPVYKINGNRLFITVPPALQTRLPGVIDVQLK
jgi:alpha-L-fucosidase